MENKTAVQPEDVESWEPSPEDWYAAKVSYRQVRGYLFLELTNGEQVFASNKTITNLPNQHECLIRPGDSKTHGEGVLVRCQDHVGAGFS